MVLKTQTNLVSFPLASLYFLIFASLRTITEQVYNQGVLKNSEVELFDEPELLGSGQASISMRPDGAIEINQPNIYSGFTYLRASISGSCTSGGKVIVSEIVRLNPYSYVIDQVELDLNCSGSSYTVGL